MCWTEEEETDRKQVRPRYSCKEKDSSILMGDKAVASSEARGTWFLLSHLMTCK